MPAKLKRVDRDLEKELDKELDRINKQKPSRPTQAQLKKFVGKTNNNQKQKEENKMFKNINYKKIVETLKTVIIVALIAGVIGFGLGVKYQEQKSDQINQKIAEQIKNLK